MFAESFTPTQAIAASQLSLVVADAALLVQTPATDPDDPDDGSFVTVHGVPAVVDKAGDTVSTALTLLDWFADVTATNGSLEHVSLVGLDNSVDDGAAGWGLVTLR